MNINRFKKFIINVYTSGASEGADLVTTQKIVLLNVLFTLGTPMLLIFGISALKSGRISMGIVELFSVTVVVFAFIHMRKTHQYFVAGMISTLMMFILCFVLFVSGGVANTGHVWTFSRRFRRAGSIA